MKIPITEEYAERLFFNEGDDQYDLMDFDEWIGGGKYESCAPVYRSKTSGQHFAMFISRSGSYHSDYYYNFPSELVEVKEIEVIRKEWSVV